MERDRYRELVDNLPEIVFEMDDAGVIVYVNEAGARVLGCTVGEIVGKAAIEFVSEADRAAAAGRIDEIMAGGNDRASGELTLHPPCAHPVPCRITVSPVVRDGRVRGLRGVVADISARKELEDRLVKSEERFRRISDMAREGIVLHDNRLVLDANRAFAEMFGMSVDEIIGMELDRFIPPDCMETIRAHLRQRTGTPCETRGIRKNGEVFDVEVAMKSIMQGGKKLYAVVVQDITHRKRIEHLQTHDELTELPNARGFARLLKSAIDTASQRRVKLVVTTVRFSQDPLSLVRGVSHDMERVLCNAVPMEIAERLRDALFPEDVIARVSEGDFMTMHALREGHNENSPVKIIQKVLGIFSSEFVRGIRMVPRVGVTFFPDDSDTRNPGRIIQNSRYACEEAILRNQDYVFYDEQSHAETRERIEFVHDLVIAVREEGCRNFMLYYQAKVDACRNIVGMEALVRWAHPRWNIPSLGYVPPSRFIGVAEDTGLISEIGAWVLREACRQTVIWQRRDERLRNLQVAVNVSPKQFNDEFLDFLDRVLLETGIAPESLELEITESESMKDRNIRIILLIRARNVSVAIDDFGIEYSSLSKLPKLPVNTIKLDQSYIQNIAIDSDYEHLVNSTITMVHGFRYKVVAEGVEDEGQAAKLFGDMGCDRIQGFYFSKPLPAAEFEKLLFPPGG